MNDTKHNPYAEAHAKASKRTPSRQYPAGLLVSANDAPDDYYRNIESAMWNLISDYERQHGTLPPADWRPDVSWFGVVESSHPFDPDDVAQVVLEACAEEVMPPCADDLAGDIIYHYKSNAYEGWDEGWDDKGEIIQALAPALAYAEKYGEFGNRAELARLLTPVGEIVNKWFLGYEEDSGHAIDIEPEHVAAFVRNWTQQEDSFNDWLLDQWSKP